MASMAEVKVKVRPEPYEASGDEAPRAIVVIESWERRGTGHVESPYRRVRQYHALDGTFLAEVDPCPESLP